MELRRLQSSINYDSQECICWRELKEKCLELTFVVVIGKA